MLSKKFCYALLISFLTASITSTSTSSAPLIIDEKPIDVTKLKLNLDLKHLYQLTTTQPYQSEAEKFILNIFLYTSVLTLYISLLVHNQERFTMADAFSIGYITGCIARYMPYDLSFENINPKIKDDILQKVVDRTKSLTTDDKKEIIQQSQFLLEKCTNITCQETFEKIIHATTS